MDSVLVSCFLSTPRDSPFLFLARWLVLCCTEYLDLGYGLTDCDLFLLQTFRLEVSQSSIAGSFGVSSQDGCDQLTLYSRILEHSIKEREHALSP